MRRTVVGTSVVLVFGSAAFTVTADT